MAGRQALPAKEDVEKTKIERKQKGYLRVIIFCFYRSLKENGLPASSSTRAADSGLTNREWFIESIKLIVLEVLKSYI
jgi:hypothetical protein